MANGLGDIASLLGQSYVESARQREDDYERYRKDQTKNQLLTMFAAPIVQGLGEGVVDFAGDLFLGDAAKNFFSTQEGAAFQRRIADARKPLDRLKTQEEILLKSAEGGDIYQGGINLALKRKRDQELAKYAELGKSAEAEIRAATFALDEDEERMVRAEVDELLDGIRNLESLPTDQELLSRYKETKLSRSTPQKLFSGIWGKITGRDYNKEVRDPAIRFMLTGGDPAVAGSEWYDLVSRDENFKQRLSDYINKSSNLRSSLDATGLENAFTAFKQLPENRPTFDRLDRELELLRDAKVEEFRISEAAQTNDRVARAQAELKKAGVPVNTRSISREIAEEIKGIDDLDRAVDYFFTNQGAKHVKDLREALAMREHGVAFGDDKMSRAERNEIDDFIRDQFKQGFVRFNTDLVFARDEYASDLNFQKIDNIISKSGMFNLSMKYVDKMFSDHMPIKTEQIAADSVFQALMRGDVDLPEGFVVDDNQELRSLIISNLTDRDVMATNENEAIDRGITATQRQVTMNRGELFDPRILTAVNQKNQTFENILEDISLDLSLSEAERKNKMKSEIADLQQYLDLTARQQGFRGLDPIFESDLEKLMRKFGLVEEEDRFREAYLRGRAK